MKKDFTIKYATSGDLMQAIRALDEKGKVAVLDAFVAFYDTDPTSTSPHLCDRFGDDYGTYREFKDSDYAYLFLKRSLSLMEIIVDEMDYIDPMNFFTHWRERLTKSLKNIRLNSHVSRGVPSR